MITAQDAYNIGCNYVKHNKWQYSLDGATLNGVTVSKIVTELDDDYLIDVDNDPEMVKKITGGEEYFCADGVMLVDKKTGDIHFASYIELFDQLDRSRMHQLD